MSKPEDGRYILFPVGGSWKYAEIKDGVCIASAYASDLSTHVAARDQYAWLGDVGIDGLEPVELDWVQHASIVRAVLGEDTYPEMVAICRLGENES